MKKIGTINGKIVYQVKDKNEYIKYVKFFSDDEDRYCIIQLTNSIICNNMEVGYLRNDNSIEWFIHPCIYYKYKKEVEEKVEAPIILPVGEEINEVDDILNSVWKKEVLE